MRFELGFAARDGGVIQWGAIVGGLLDPARRAYVHGLVELGEEGLDVAVNFVLGGGNLGPPGSPHGFFKRAMALGTLLRLILLITIFLDVDHEGGNERHFVKIGLLHRPLTGIVPFVDGTQLAHEFPVEPLADFAQVIGKKFAHERERLKEAGAIRYLHRRYPPA